MFKPVCFFLIFACIYTGMPFFAFAQSNQSETLTITTYYPAPYGVYRNLEVKRGLAIGNIANGPIGSINNLQPGQLYINSSVILNSLATYPANPKAGQVIYYVGGGSKLLQYYDGTTWVNATSSGSNQTDVVVVKEPSPSTGVLTCPDGYKLAVKHWKPYGPCSGFVSAGCCGNTWVICKSEQCACLGVQGDAGKPRVESPLPGLTNVYTCCECTTPAAWSQDPPTCKYTKSTDQIFHCTPWNIGTCTATEYDAILCEKQ